MALNLKCPKPFDVESKTDAKVSDLTATTSLPSSMRFTVENASKDSKIATSLREMFAQLDVPVPEFLDSDEKVAEYTTVVFTIALKSGAVQRDIGRLVAVLPEIDLLSLVGIEKSEDTNTFVLDGTSIILVGYSFPRKAAPSDDKLAAIPAVLEALTVALESATIETTPEVDVAALTEGIRGIRVSEAVKDAGKKAMEARREEAKGEEAKKEITQLDVPAFKAKASISPALFACLPIGATNEDSGLSCTEDAAKAGLNFFVEAGKREAVFAAAAKMCDAGEKKEDEDNGKSAEGGGGSEPVAASGNGSDEAPKAEISDAEKDAITEALSAAVASFTTSIFGTVVKMASVANPGEDGTLEHTTLASNVETKLMGLSDPRIVPGKPIDPTARRALTLYNVGKDTVDSVAGMTTFNGDKQALILRMENVTLDSLFRNFPAPEEAGPSMLESIAAAMGCGPSRKAAGEIVREKRGICG